MDSPSPIPLSESHAGSQLELNDEILSGVWSSDCETFVVLHAFHRIPALLGMTVSSLLVLGVSLLFYFGIESLYKRLNLSFWSNMNFFF